MPPDFSWLDWSGHPSTLIGVLTLEAAYIYGAGNLRGRLGGASAVSIRQATCFTLGMFVIYLALNSPIHELSDRYLFSAHMVQHMLLLWIMPPLVIWGLPDWLIRPAISSPIRLKAAKNTCAPAGMLSRIQRHPRGMAPANRIQRSAGPPQLAHLPAPLLHGCGHPDVVAGAEPPARASPPAIWGTDALPVPDIIAASYCRRHHQLRRQRGLRLVRRGAPPVGESRQLSTSKLVA